MYLCIHKGLLAGSYPTCGRDELAYYSGAWGVNLLVLILILILIA